MNNINNIQITVVGIGYVGMSIATLLAQKCNVTVLDIDTDKTEKIKKGISPVKDEYIEKYIKEKKLQFKVARDFVEAYRYADYVVIATPTDYDEKQKRFNTTAIETVIEQVSNVNSHAVIVIKSTVPIGYTITLCEKYKTSKIIFIPEFLRESKALYDNLYPSRIIIGCDDKNRKEAERFSLLLKGSTVKENVPILFMGISEAEAVKLFSNTYLAMRVAFFNELDTYAETNGLNTYHIIKGMCMDSRIGDYYNNPSFGYGGYCLPKDTKQLLANYGTIPENLISAIVNSNYVRKEYITKKILDKAGYYDLKNKDCIEVQQEYIIGIYRLIMKQGSDNFRYSAIQGIIKRLKKKKVKIVIYEPKILDNHFEDLEVMNNIKRFKKSCTVIVANRVDENLEDVKEKVYTRDIFSRD